MTNVERQALKNRIDILHIAEMNAGGYYRAAAVAARKEREPLEREYKATMSPTEIAKQIVASMYNNELETHGRENVDFSVPGLVDMYFDCAHGWNVAGEKRRAQIERIARRLQMAM